MSELATDQLAALIDQKHGCLVQLREIGREQQRLIECGDMTQLLRVLASKQHFLATLQGVERGLSRFRDEDPDTRLWRRADDRARCAAQAEACRELLDEVVRQEQTNEQQMRQRRHEVAERLQHTHVAVRASGAYRAHTAHVPTAANHSSGASPHFGDRSQSDSSSSQPDEAASHLDVASDIR